MKKKLVLLSDWASKHKIPLQKAKDAARRGKLKAHVQVLQHPGKRFFIEEGISPDVLG
jgi:hypothetical protein